MNLNLKDKRVLITGSSRGIGASIAEAFLKEGSKICLISRNIRELQKKKKDLSEYYNKENIIFEKCDCTNNTSLKILKRKIISKWSKIDIVIANVGDGRSNQDIIQTPKQWEKTWDKNFNSALYTARNFLPLLKKSNGCLLFISSITGIEALGAPVDYSTAKAAILALCKNLSKKLGSQVRVNVIAPGNIYFENGIWYQKIKNNKKDVSNYIKTNVPMNKLGCPDDISDAALFLCSDRAKFITGATLVVDGGQTKGVF